MQPTPRDNDVLRKLIRYCYYFHYYVHVRVGGGGARVRTCDDRRSVAILISLSLSHSRGSVITPRDDIIAVRSFIFTSPPPRRRASSLSHSWPFPSHSLAFSRAPPPPPLSRRPGTRPPRRRGRRHCFTRLVVASTQRPRAMISRRTDRPPAEDCCWTEKRPRPPHYRRQNDSRNQARTHARALHREQEHCSTAARRAPFASRPPPTSS